MSPENGTGKIVWFKEAKNIRPMGYKCLTKIHEKYGG